VIVAPDFSRLQSGFVNHLRPLSRRDPARRAAVARRGLSRRHRKQLERAARLRGWPDG
jgi:hypothetical protein